MIGLQKYFHELHVAPRGQGESNNGSLRGPGPSSSFSDGGPSSLSPPVLSLEDQDELERILQESKKVISTEREILAAQKARKEATRSEAKQRYDRHLAWLKEATKEHHRQQKVLRKVPDHLGDNPGEEAARMREQLKQESQMSQRQMELSVQESQAACEFDQSQASQHYQRSMAALGAEKYDVQSFMDRQRNLREQQIAEFTDAYRHSQRQGPPGDRHRSVALEALAFIRKAQALERVRQGERPDAATYHSLRGDHAAAKKRPQAEQKGAFVPAGGPGLLRPTPASTPRSRVAQTTPRGLATQARVILQPMRPLDPWQLR